MNKQRQPANQHTSTGRMWAGIIIVGIGTILLAGKLGLDWIFPHWVFNWHNMWPMVLIVVGLIIGGNSNFRNPSSYILLGLGAFFLIRNITDFNIGAFIWPVVIIAIGLWLLSGKSRGGPCAPRPDGRRRYRERYGDYEWDKRVKDETDGSAHSGATAFGATGDHSESNSFSEMGTANGDTGSFTSEDYLKSTAIFSDVKKIIISKRFQGGEIVNVCGGTDLNLIQADIQQPIVIDVFQLFAGTKIIVPAHWKIQSEVVSVFGEVSDRRFSQGTPYDEQKIVYIRGTSIFGGITIKNI
ncbi:cell wall-active antibiotics response protein [Parapedobacter soli]|uniref:cell wall-active antibiotics response protein n=1 Tax=Parapedobacter soli TaxID=416955 RepID=UPI0021C85257|nr:cell wall-active antibiotics response protein [Parapedobacter soli]